MNIRRLCLWFIFISSALFLSGCLASFFRQKPSILPPYIHKIAVRPFANHTQQYGLEDKLTLAIQSELNRDGRYQITTENQADAVLIGDITRYTPNPLSYDTSHIPTEYILTIETEVSFLDKVKNQTLWKEPDMTGELRYYTVSSGLAGQMSETDAQQVIWDQLSRDIVTRTIEGFGTVTKGPELENPKSNTGNSNSSTLNNPPPMPSEQPTAPSPTPQPY